MDIARLLGDESLRREEFPIVAGKTFLAHAAASPLPRRVSLAIQRYAGDSGTKGQWEFLYSQMELEARQYAAKLMEALPEEIAFVSSTSMGLSLVAGGLPWKRGDRVVVADGDFPSNIYPWLNLADRGVEVKFIPRRRDGAVTLDDIGRVIDARTRLVSLSSVSFVTGYRIDVDAIGDYLHQRGILFCVDAVQSLGAFPISTRHVDFLASSAHKWLLGPLGIGVLYIKKEHLDKLHPILAGWKSVAFNKRYLTYNLIFLDSAQRYEPGGLSILGLMGLHAALKLLLEVGIDIISAQIEGLRNTLVEALSSKGYELLCPAVPEHGSGIVSFTSDKIDIVETRNNLDAAGYVVSLRDTLDGRKCIRVAPHFYNTEAEIINFMSGLPRI